MAFFINYYLKKSGVLCLLSTKKIEFIETNLIILASAFMKRNKFTRYQSKLTDNSGFWPGCFIGRLNF